MKKGIIILVLILASLTSTSQTVQENDSIITSVIVKSMNTEPEKWEKLTGYDTFFNKEMKIAVNSRYTEGSAYLGTVNSGRSIIYKCDKVNSNIEGEYTINDLRFSLLIYNAGRSLVLKKQEIEYKNKIAIKTEKEAAVVDYFKELAKK